MKKHVILFFSILLMAVFTACNQENIDQILNQSDEIASIRTQIGNIQTSIASLEKMDTQLKSQIEELTQKEKDLASADEAQAKEIASLKESLTQKESALSKRIDDLKTYVDDELKKQKDWVSATFSTLEQYQSTCNEIANIKQSLSNAETTIKNWVNEQLTGYYTVAEMNAKVSALEKAIKDGDDAQAAELDKLKAALDTAKADIKKAYEKAITDAITTSEGKINKKIAADIKSATDALQGQIDAINTKIEAIETRLDNIETSLWKILSQVQSIVVVPNYSDGSVRITDYEDPRIYFQVYPFNAITPLLWAWQQKPEVFSLDVILTETKSLFSSFSLPIKSITYANIVETFIDGIEVTIDALGMDMAALSNPSLCARLKIDDGNTSMSTSYFGLTKNFVSKPLSEVKNAYANWQNSWESWFSDGCSLSYLTGPVRVEVISNSQLNNLDSRLMYVQDYSAGMAVYCNAPHGYEFGDVLSIDISEAIAKKYNGYLEITNLSLDKITKIGHKDEIQPRYVNIDSFLADEFESQYVAIWDVQIAENDLGKTWVMDNKGTSIKVESRDGSEFLVHTRSAATYGAVQVPQGSGLIKGIATKYNDKVQLLFAQETDWAGMTEARFSIQEHEYTLSIGADTKANFSDNQMIWNAGDKVLLTDGNSSVVCTIPQEYDGQKTAKVKTTRNFGGTVRCIYPGESVTQDGDAFYADIPVYQVADGSKYVVLYGSSSSSYIQLRPSNAMFKFSLRSDVEGLSSVKITFEGSPAAGTLRVDDQGSTVVSGTQSVEVSAHGNNDFYFSVLPGSITKMYFDVYKSDGSFARRSSDSFSTFQAGTVYSYTIDPSLLDFGITK